MKPPITPTKEILDRRLYLTLPVGKSVNHCYITTRWGKKILTKEAKAWFKEARQILMKAINDQQWGWLQQTKVIVEAKVFWQDYRTRDTSNLDKNLCDAFEDYVLDNDCYLLIRWIDWEIDRENPRVELAVRAFDPAKDGWQYEKEFKR